MIENARPKAPSPRVQISLPREGARSVTMASVVGTSEDALPAELSLQQEQTDSLIDQTLSLVETVTELEEPEQTPSPMQQPVAKQIPSDVQLTEPARNASLINQMLSLVKNVAVPEPKPIEVAPPSSQQPRAKQLTPKERLDMERADIQKRIATFKANLPTSGARIFHVSKRRSPRTVRPY